MRRLLYSILLLIAVVAPTQAQQSAGCKDKDGVVYAPRKGQWQVSLMLGNSGQTYGDDYSALLSSKITNTSGSIGLPNGSTATSGQLGSYLNISGMTDNSLTNMLGVQLKYFVSDNWSLNLSLGMNIDVTPSKDYVEGDYETVTDMIIPEQKYINAQTSNNWFVNVGTDRYFKTSNPRIHPYVGVTAGFQMARVDTKEPYVGTYADGEDDFGDEEIDGLDKHVYYAAGNVGEMFAIKGGLVTGVEYSLSKGLILALECQPLVYRYDVIQICPQGFDKYLASHHNIKLIEMPVLKLGFRF